MCKQLSAAENNKLVVIKSELDRIRPMFDHDEWPRPFKPFAALAHAYGVSGDKVRECVTRHLHNNCSTKRKVRSDAGHTLVTSVAKRNKLYTPYNHFKKLQRKRRPGEIIASLFSERGWVWTTQPANSPLTNIMDAAMFPALAKNVSAFRAF